EQEAPVGDVGKSGKRVGAEVQRRLAVVQRERDERRHEDADQRRGHEATRPAREEIAERDATLRRELRQQQAGDEEAREREERREPEETALQAVVVECEHGDEGQRAQAVETGLITQSSPLGHQRSLYPRTARPLPERPAVSYP